MAKPKRPSKSPSKSLENLFGEASQLPLVHAPRESTEPCQFCGKMFTSQGLPNHEKTCPERKEAARNLKKELSKPESIKQLPWNKERPKGHSMPFNRSEIAGVRLLSDEKVHNIYITVSVRKFERWVEIAKDLLGVKP